MLHSRESRAKKAVAKENDTGVAALSLPLLRLSSFFLSLSLFARETLGAVAAGYSRSSFAFAPPT